jgi:hypothetical protein
MKYVQSVDTDIDHDKLLTEVEAFIDSHRLSFHPQLSLTSVSGNDDWQCSVGKLHALEYPERYYSTINKSIAGTYINDLISRYPDFYRWRLLRLDGRSCYSIHSDRNAGDQVNIRLHIPVKTNPQAFLCFYPDCPESGQDLTIRYEHLELGSSYRVNTTGLHTAINHGMDYRYHIVGVKYEDSNNWS